MNTQKRYRSKAAWVTTLAFLGFILKNYFKIELVEYDMLVEGILGLATVWGIFNNPCQKGRY